MCWMAARTWASSPGRCAPRDRRRCTSAPGPPAARAVPIGHPLAGEQQLTLRQTLAYQHIGLHEGSTLLTFLRDQVERLAVSYRRGIQVSSFEAGLPDDRGRSRHRHHSRVRGAPTTAAPCSWRWWNWTNPGRCASAAFWFASWTPCPAASVR
ncbi:MAG: hypothetical protein MZV63_21600 [Marinilabiliales bacterium]|nr:hypothetical protein [Marinilabiliales bacterium]